MNLLPSWRRRERRALLVGAFIILPSLVFGRGLPAIRRWELREIGRWREVASEIERFGRASRAHRATFAGGIGQRNEIASLRNSITSAATIAEAAGDLAEYVGDIAHFAGAQVRSIGVDGDSTFKAGVGKVVLRLAVTTDTEGMFSILRELAVGPKQVALRALAITQSNPASPHEQPEIMSVELTLESVVLRMGEEP